MNLVKDDTKIHSSEDSDKKTRAKMAADLLQSLTKAVKALKLYPDNNPIRHKFISDLASKFTKFLDEYGDITLTVRQHDLLYQGETVYSQHVKEDNIAFRFFGDGIREIVFSEDLHEQELIDFIDIIQVNRERENGDDDIVTLMWEKEFKNIRYIVAEDGGEAAGDRETTHPSANASVSATGIYALRNAHKAECAQGKMMSESKHRSAGIEHEVEQIYGKPIGEIFVLTSDEISKVKDEIETEAKCDFTMELLDILFHITDIEDDTDSYVEMMSFIEMSVKSMMFSGDYTYVIEVLTRIRGISETRKVSNPRHAESAEGVIDALGNEAFLQEFTRYLNESNVDNADEIYSVLTMLNKNSIMSLVNMLSRLDKMKLRRIVCDALAVIAKDDLDVLLRKLQDGNWYVVRNILYVLGRIGDARVINHIKRIMNHGEPKVRLEIIHTLSEIKSEEVSNMLVSFLNDSDNSVRISALKRLSSLGLRNAVPDILRIISSDEFEGKEIHEKKELFEALALLGTKDQLPYLKELLMKKSWLFGRAFADEMRMLSVHALRSMDVPGAMDIIKEGASSSDKVIRKICEDTLRDLMKGNI